MRSSRVALSLIPERTAKLIAQERRDHAFVETGDRHRRVFKRGQAFEREPGQRALGEIFHDAPTVLPKIAKRNGDLTPLWSGLQNGSRVVVKVINGRLLGAEAERSVAAHPEADASETAEVLRRTVELVRRRQDRILDAIEFPRNAGSESACSMAGRHKVEACARGVGPRVGEGTARGQVRSAVDEVRKQLALWSTELRNEFEIVK